jgi:hypothetical protein
VLKGVKYSKVCGDMACISPWHLEIKRCENAKNDAKDANNDAQDQQIDPIEVDTDPTLDIQDLVNDMVTKVESDHIVDQLQDHVNLNSLEKISESVFNSVKLEKFRKINLF